LELYGSSIVHTPGYFKVEKTMIGGHIRGSLDYYLSRRLSLQGKIDLRLMPEGISVPATNYEGKTLRQHTVNFSSMGFSIGLAVHF